jgi:DNA-binding beta-propeller fold protein YncE
VGKCRQSGGLIDECQGFPDRGRIGGPARGSWRVRWAGFTIERMRKLSALLMCAWLATLAGCDREKLTIGTLQLVWGRLGISDGRFQKPRAMAIDKQDRVYIVDMTARIQVFDADGNFIRSWQTPAHENGRPTGMSIDRDGNLAVADTHYFEVLFYSPEGELLRKIGPDHGQGPGQFGLVTDVVEDSAGNYYVSEYGELDRVQKFSHDGKFLLQWGEHGEGPGQFSRPQGLEVDDEDRVWVADSANHRIQVFDNQGKLLFMWGIEGTAPGQLSYPYNLALDGQGHVYVVEMGNNRVQEFSLDGKSLGVWGTAGGAEGQLFNPWALGRDSKGRVHILDTGNNRVERVQM